MDDAVRGEHQQTGCDQELVGDGIQHSAERRLLVPYPGIVAIEKIGDAGGNEHRQGYPAQPQRAIHNGLGVDAADHHRNGGDSCIGQYIRHGKRVLRGALCRCDVHPSYQYCRDLKVNSGAHKLALDEGYINPKPVGFTRLAGPGVEKVEDLLRALRAHPGNLAKIGDRCPFDLLQRSKMMQQRTFA